MIVTCTQCQARFRVADEKVGARGARMRCTKCKSVFMVKREEAAPAPEVAPPPPPVPPPLPEPPRLELDLDVEPSQRVAAPPPLPPKRAPDPSAADFDDPFAPALDADPFAPSASGPSADLDSSPAYQDPFAVPPPSEPLGAQRSKDPFAAPPAAADPVGETASPDPFASMSAPNLLAGASAAPLADELPPELGDPGFDPLGHNGVNELDVFPASAAPPPDPVIAPATGAGPRVVGRMTSPAEPEPAQPPETTAPPPAPVAHSTASLLVSALSLAVMCLATLAMLIVWRTGALEARSFRPDAIMTVLRGGTVSNGTVDVVRMTNGLYETRDGASLLLVRGEVVNRTSRGIGRVQVRLELADGERVVAQAEGRAGGLPTPEDLWSTSGQQDVVAAMARAAARAPAELRPGVPVPFLIALGDFPTDLAGLELRVTARPEASPEAK